MNRPDFRGIRILIDSFQALDKDFQRMFDQAAEQEAGLKECCARILREQAVCGLADIPVEELRNARAGIRVAALEQAGYHSLLDLHEADEWSLQSVEGIGEKQAASIRMLIDTFLEKLSASGRIRLTTDIPATNTSAANVSAENTSAMGIPAANTFTTDTPAANITAAGIAARNTSATGTSSARAVLAADSRVLITLLARSREAALVRRDAEPLREEFHTQVEAGIQAVEIRNRFRWIFSGRQKKERTLLAVGSLLELDRSPLCRRVRHLLSLYNNAVKISEKEAVADFKKNSAPYYAWLEARGGIFAPQKMIYSSIPAQLAARIDAAPLDLTAFKGNLRAYQAFGTRYILTQKRVLLGDEMGLGKTIQAIAAMSHLTAEKRQSLSASHLQTEGTQSPTIEAESVQTPATATGGGQISAQQPHFLVVCPASVMINWCREIVKFSEVKAHLLHGPFLETSFERWNTDGGAAVTNYESMGKIFSRIDGKMRLALLVIDEAHYIKNPEAKRTRYIHSLEDESDRILLMTGTPLENNVIEMCQLIGFVRPDMDWKIRENAAMRHVPAFREMLAPVYLRRQRDQVLDELPPCTEEEEWCAMTPQDLETYSSCAIEGSFNGMRRVSFLQDDLRTSSKAVRLLELCEEAGDEGKRIVIYSFFRETLRKTAALLEDWNKKREDNPDMPAGQIDQVCEEDQTGSHHIYIGMITGSTPAADRQKIVDR
ncbi:MAG: SNF2-related protein, partial [Sarcina sp.]|nr:SNF2-related protein [Sarcina sp.]